MTRRIGLELTDDRIRAVTVGQWNRAPHESFEIRWDPRAPRDAVAVLRKQLGEVSSVGLSIGLAFTHAKHVKLPPVSQAERRGILTLEPDRFFAIDSGDIVVATLEGSDLVFAAESAAIDLWVTAFEEWAPVVVAEPSSLSVERAMRLAGVRSGVFQIPSGNDEGGLVEIANSMLTDTRRLGSAAFPANARLVPAVRGVASEFVPAYGAAIGASAPLAGMLLPPAAMARVGSRRRMGLARAGVNFLLALAFVLAALDRSRTRVLDRVQQEIAALSPRAEAPSAIQARLAQLDLESSTARSAGSAHADPVSVLATLSRRLPLDAVVMSLRADGDEWQIDGTARDAAAIVPALDADPAFDNVRFLSASSRFNENSRTYETFSVALHAHR